MKEIRGDAKNIRALLGGAKYAIDYYQREYRWEPKQVSELISDLADKFLESHDDDNERSAVEGYGHYFLGSIIISDKDGQKFIIDGQQRLTTLTLLLIYLRHKLDDDEQKSQLTDLIISQKYGKRSFNLDVPERSACMEALFEGRTLEGNDQPESVHNILSRYQDIRDEFPEDLSGPALPFFTDWLIENVHLVEITAYSDEDAYTIFETMNDRGLSLTPTDMLKGYLLANIADTKKRNEASQIWRDRIALLKGIGKEEDADAIKSWLRSQHAESIRERKRGAKQKDFDLIGTEFHRWVRDREKELELSGSSDFFRFIQQDFAFYTRWFQRVREAADTYSDELKHVFYNGQSNFTLQYPVVLAPLRTKDGDDVCLRKIRIASAFLEILLARRMWNFRSIDYSTMQYAMFLVIKDIRGVTVSDLVKVLTARLAEDKETFASNDRFHLHGTNGKQIHRLLARMTDYVETGSGMASRYTEYIQRRGKHGYEVEHIWANHPERHKQEFSHPADFLEYRNRFGGLLLLPKSFNASYGDLTYAKKHKHYLKQNLLAQSLHPDAYERSPGFKKFIKKTGLPFKAHSQFDRADLDARQELYRQLAETVWDPALLKELAEK